MNKLKQEWLKVFVGCLLASFSFVSCNNNDDSKEDGDDPVISLGGYYVLNEGLYEQNNGSLGVYDLDTKTYETDFFRKQNGRGLGDTSQDMIIYGGKIYIAVTGSGTIEVTDLACKSIKQITSDDSDAPLLPRNLVAHGGKVYVSLQDGFVACVDTTTLAIEKKIAVGLNPEQMAVANNKLYVANSGGNSFPDYDNTVSVVSLPDFTELKKIEVILNPMLLQADKDGNIWLISNGDYYNPPNTLQCIKTATDEVEVVTEGTQMAILKNTIYIMNSKFTEPGWQGLEVTYKVYDYVKGEVIADAIVTDGTTILNPFKVGAIPSEDLFYVTESDYSSTGDVCLFNLEGKLQHKFEAGLSPVKVIRIP